MTKTKQSTEFVNDINEDELIQIKEYEGLKLDDKRVLFYMPIHYKYKPLKPNYKDE